MMDLFKEWFGDHGTLTPASRFLILLFASVGLVCAPMVTWFAKGAYDEFKGQSEKLAEIQLYLSGATERARARDARTTILETVNGRQQDQLNDHERRLIRIETRGQQ